jgi:hypothetical protein
MKKDLESKDKVLEAVRELYATEQLVTRETVAQVTGYTLTIVDDRLGILVDDGHIRRVQRGIYMPAATFPATRAISKTILSDGLVKIEIGDDVLTLTPRESRALGELTAGAAAEFAAIDLGREVNERNGALYEEVSRLKKRLAILERRQVTPPEQGDLALPRV